MHEVPTQRQCGRCYFCRSVAEKLCCLRDAPVPDPATGRARWPAVGPTDTCGCFRYADGCPLAADCWPKKALPVCTDAFGDFCKVPLSQGKFAKVDPEDYIWLSQFRWSAKIDTSAIYAVRTVQVKGRSKRIFMHRQIMNTPPGLVCDHINHDGLDNRKRNCRNCTSAQNNANRRSAPTASSPFVGVSWDKRRQKWVVHIKKDGIPSYLGAFDDELEAARAHDRAAVAVHGEYANLNFPEEWPGHPAGRGNPKS